MKMLIIMMCLFFLSFDLATAQYDGDFWWLNKKLSDYREMPSAPKFEQLSKYDTDENDKIVFREDPIEDNRKNHKEDYKTGKGNRKPGNVQFEMHFEDKSAIVWPDRKKADMRKNRTSTKDNKNKKKPNLEEDVFEFKLTGDNNFVEQNHVTNPKKTLIKTTNKPNIKKALSTTINSITNKVTTQLQQADAESESICTIMIKAECTSIGGAVYMKQERDSSHPIFETRRICCILPMTNDKSTKIHFRDDDDNDTQNQRFKRSTSISGNTGTKQRMALLLRKYASRIALTAAKRKQSDRITTADDYYDDPYSNIKNHKNQKKHKVVTHYDCDNVEDEYADELPTPGLVGLYSDNGGSWSNGGGNDNSGAVSPYDVVDDDYEDGGTSFSYGATIDPRLDRVSTKPLVIGRPVKISTTSVQNTYDEDSRTISYQSNPDFQVMQGFKLLNLVRNKSRIHRGKKTTTTERQIDDDSDTDSKETVLIASSFESGDDHDSFDKNMQVYENCGREAKSFAEDYERDKLMGNTVKGSHPWLALVTLTRRKQKIQCYATIVHPRAAVTTADCVHGQSPGDLTLIAGAWDLNSESKENWQKRLASFHEHFKYRPGNVVAYNLAVLHWKRSLRLNANVQPVCLSDPHAGSECKFFGWGGYDQAIRQRSMWQKATLLNPRLCSECVTSKRQSLPSDSFCATVKSRRSVTGIGGSLVCKAGNRHMAVGVAAWRDDVVILIPTHQWVRDAVEALGLV